jgi:ATP-dependent DNA helicase RecG
MYINPAAPAQIPPQLDFLSPISNIPRLGPKRVAALESVGIKRVGDLLNYYPVRYIDRSKTVEIEDMCNADKRVAGQARDDAGVAADNAPVTVTGVVSAARTEYFGRPKFRVTLKGGGGAELDALWYIRGMKIAAGERLMLTGPVLAGRGRPLMIHPVIEKLSGDDAPRPILAVYALRGALREAGVNQKLLRRCVEWALGKIESGNYPRLLPESIEKRKNFPPLRDCLLRIHLPDDLSSLDMYRARLKYEELYRLALDLRWNRRKFALPGYAMLPGGLVARLRGELPFALTESQEAAVAALHADAARPARMHRLLQGDVGSGKTVTALFAALPALNSGRQVAWMAPTEVLARQTESVIRKYLCGLGIRVEYLGAGNTPDKRRTLSELASGELRFVVGTHALFMPSVNFSNLGMVIIDEQHKFGAAQRLRLHDKGPASDVLLMSATPIPQTLAKTLYGDLDAVEIASRPGLPPVSTRIVPEGKRAGMEGFILERVKAGERAFCVVPRIEEQQDDGDDEEEGAPPLKTVESVAERLKSGPLSAVPIRTLHGRMPPDERDAAISAFKDGPPGVLVSTAIVEVGVDVPDATVMVVENPELFGLAQLHQIRGRVGRGAAPSYCFLLPGSTACKDERTMARLKFICGCSDGFKIAEHDLRARGPGDAAGYRQSGWDGLLAADIMEDSEMFREILTEIDELFQNSQ